MPLTIATWNINSVRIRLNHITRFVADAKPDILCLQETKCRDGEFPSAAFVSLGLRHLHVIGQKGHHGVAIASRFPLQPLTPPPFCRHNEARVTAVRVKGLVLHNVYVPAGGETPDPLNNAKFEHKLDVLRRMEAHYAATLGDEPRLLVGDLNIAPGEHDVWSHAHMVDEVGHTPAETEGLERVRVAGEFVDLPRMFRPSPEKLFSWWGYRNGDWKTSNRGQRLDHIWAHPTMAARCESIEFHVAARDWDRPSDHVPIKARFAM